MVPLVSLVDTTWIVAESIWLPLTGMLMITLWLVWYLRRTVRPARVRSQNWYDRRCQILAHRHSLNSKEQEAFRRRQSLLLKSRMANRDF